MTELSLTDSLIKARIALLLDRPFYGNLALHLPLKENNFFDTFATDGKFIYYNKEFAKKCSDQDKQFILTHEICLKPYTFIWNKEIKDFNKDDLIIGNDGKEHIVVAKSKRKYNGKIIRIKPQGCIPIEITPNHPILTIGGIWKGNRKWAKNKTDRSGENQFIFNKFKWKKADEVTLNDWVVIPKIKLNEEYQNYKVKFKSKNYWSLSKQIQEGITINEDIAYFLGLYTADGSATISTYYNQPKISYIKCEKCHKEIIKSSPNLKYCVDCSIKFNYGHRSKEQNKELKEKGYHRIWDKPLKKNTVIIGIALNAKKEMKLAYKLSNIINKSFGLKTRFVYRGNCVYVIFGSLPLAKFLREEIGTGANNKRIPKFIMFNNEKIRKAFLRGFIDGDGYNNKQKIGFATTSKRLAFQLHLLCISLGFFVNMNFERRSNKNIFKLNKKRPNKKYCRIYTFNSGCHRTFKGLNLKGFKRTNRKTYHFKEYKDYILVRVKKIEKKKYKGYVYNLETTNHNYLANNVIVHNCHVIFHHLSRLGERHQKRWDLAVDYATNAILKKDFGYIPKDGYYEQKFENMTAEEIYNKIPDMNGKGKGMKGGYKRFEGKEMTIEIDKDGNMKINGKDVKPFDEHKPIKGSKKEIDELEKEWAIQVAKAYHQAKQAGKMPAGMNIFIEQLLQPKLDWRNMMRQFIITTAKSDFSFLPPNRRFVHQDMYMPSMTGESLGDIVVIIDVSGSTLGSTQQKFFSECNGLLQQYEVDMHLISCDVKITSHETYHTGDEIKKQYSGGGGTEISNAFKYINEKGIMPNIIVCLTDGYTDLNFKSNYPTLWVISKDGVDLKDVPFGMKVKMDE